MSEYKLLALSGPAVKLTLTASLLSLGIDDEFWVRLGEKFLAILRAPGNIITAPINAIVIGYNQLREEIEIECEASRARVRVGKIREVSKVYFEFRMEIESEDWAPQEYKAKLMEKVDRLLDCHLEEIIRLD